MSANGPLRDGDVHHPHGDVRAGFEEVRRRAADAHVGNVRGTRSSHARLISCDGVVHHRDGEVQHRYHEGAPPSSWRCAMVTGQGETCVPQGAPALRRAAPACARTPRDARRYAPRAPQSHLAVHAYCNAATRAFVARPRTRRGAGVPALALLVTATHDARTLTGRTAMRTMMPTTWHVAFAERTTRSRSLHTRPATKSPPPEPFRAPLRRFRATRGAEQITVRRPAVTLFVKNHFRRRSRCTGQRPRDVYCWQRLNGLSGLPLSTTTR